jgi:hypothetical protein
MRTLMPPARSSLSYAAILKSLASPEYDNSKTHLLGRKIAALLSDIQFNSKRRGMQSVAIRSLQHPEIQTY